MKPQHILGSAVALGLAASLLVPTNTDAFTTIGGSLGLGERHFRVFNNFTAATANDNTLADSNFPGYTGAPMAIWKGFIEWGSRLHGSGNGDPSQPSGLGSGGANFDPSWQGLATSSGGTNDNIASQLSGCSGGTLAFCETPISDGWRIMFYECWTWQDGPGTGVPGSQIDIQGVACHEFGHALGLGHSADGNATMTPAVVGSGVAQRSINSDDIAGVQFIYGVASAAKPIITSIFPSLGQVTINGANFASSNNEVWFTKTGTGGNGDPVKVTGVSSNGVVITVAVPVGAGPGDLLVRIPGAGHDRLSNAYPFAPDTGPPCFPPWNTCFTSPNSVDPVGAIMGYAGSQSVANNDFILIASGCPPGAAGIFYYGANETFATFGNGFRCVASPVFRTAILNVNIFGDAVRALNLNSLPPGGQINSGDTKYFQFWYRNPAGGGAGFNLSDALGVPFCP